MSEETHWSDEVFHEIKKREIASVCTVPDGGLTRLLNLVKADRSLRLITLTTEEEGMGIVTGQWLGGKRSMIAMQSSGVGNCINALGLPSVMRAPCLMLVTMRGQYGEFNPWQVQMGQGARPALEAVGVKCFPAGKYLIYYRAMHGGTDILHVFHGARDQRKALKKAKETR